MDMKPVDLPPIVTTASRSRLYEEDFLEELRVNPGEWYLVEKGRESRPSLSWARSTIEGLRVATRKNDAGTYDVYAMIDHDE